MEQVRINYQELQKAVKGYHSEVADALEVSTVSVWARLAEKVKLTLDDLNVICRVIRRKPSDFIVFEQVNENS